MALQRALSQLRGNSINNTVPSTQNEDDGAAVVQAPESASSVPIFSLEDADLFNFSDDDIFPDPFSEAASSTIASHTHTTSHTNIESPVQSCSSNKTRLQSLQKPSSCKVQSSNQTEVSHNQVSIANQSPSSTTVQPAYSASQKIPVTNSVTKSPCVVTEHSMNKLRSFKFVKTDNTRSVSSPLAGKKRSSDNASLVPLTLPQNKRRLVCDDVTNIGDDVTNSDDVINFGGSQDSSGHRGETDMTVSHGSFKQPSFNPRARSTSSVFTTTPTRTPSKNRHSEATPTSTQVTTPTSVFPFRRSIASGSVCSTPLARSSSQTSVCNTPLARNSSQTNVGEFQTPTCTSHHQGSDWNNLTPLSSQSSQRAAVFSTPRTARSATPLVCTPTNNRIAIGTPVSLKRRFPGPAGLLPTLAPGQNLDSIVIPPPSTPQPASTPRPTRLSTSALPPVVPPSQGECDPDDFSSGPWVDMLNDLDMNDSHSTALLQFNIHSMIKQSARRKLKGGKVLHLRALVKNVIPAGNNASAVLKDPTGEVLCTIHNKVLEEHQSELQPGAVLVLRQVSVFSPTPRKHYLNITPNNILRIYPPNPGTDTGGKRTPLVLSDIENDSSQSVVHRPGGTTSSQSQVPHQQHQKQRQQLQPLYENRTPFFTSSTSGSKTTTVTTCTPSNCDDGGSKETASSGDTPMDTVTDFLDDTNLLFEDLESFDDFDEDKSTSPDHVPVVSAVSSGVCTSTHESNTVDCEASTVEGNQLRKETFFNQFCEDEFDNLFSDLDF